MANFSKKSKCLKKKRKEKKKILPLRFRIIFLRYVKDCKGVRSMDFILLFEENFLYPLECREVPSGS